MVQPSTQREFHRHDLQSDVIKHLGEDGRLPAERELATKLGVSRRSLRLALAGLETEGLLVRHVGRGTFLRTSDPFAAAAHKAPPGLIETSPAEILAVRVAIEPQLVRLAVSATRPGDLVRIEHCLEQGRAAREFDDFEIWDAALHMALVAASQNGLAIAVLELINAARDQPHWGSLKRRSFDDRRRAMAQREHDDIVEAVRDRDAAKAEQRMRIHLKRVQSSMLRSAGDEG